MNPAIQGEVLQAARLLFQPGALIEVRVPKAGKQKTISGYFEDWEKLAEAVAALEAARWPGIYWTLNPVRADLVARADHHCKSYAANTTSDPDILCRRWLPVDFDPKRPAGISSTDDEHQAALDLAQQVQAQLLAEGWPDALVADSGNGGHLLFPVDLPNDGDSTELVHRVLLGIAARFGTPAVDVDVTTFNASRIFKIYGTTARKGDNVAARPHRVSRILQVPALLQPVPVDLLRAMAAAAPVDERKQAAARKPAAPGRRSGSYGDFDLRRWLDEHGIKYWDPKAYRGGRKFVLEACPFDPEHKAPDAAVFERPDGYGFRCLHNSCHGRDWRAFRELFQPDVRRDLPARMAAPECDAPGESDADLPLAAADVEAAVAAAIEAKDLAAALRLLPEIAKVPGPVQVEITGKLRQAFRRDFPSREFARELKKLTETHTRPPAPPDDEDEALKDAPDLIPYPLTDSGNGERLVALYGRDIRYVAEFKKWMKWDGRRWRIDLAGEVTQLAKLTARLLHKQAGRLGPDDADLRDTLQAHARASESNASIEAALKRALSEPGMTIRAAELDQHPYLLNFLNGVVDVRYGELLAFDRGYLITKLCHHNFNKDAKAPRFVQFLKWAMGESADDAAERESVARMVGFLQKAFGYSLTGDVSERAAFIFYGRKGANGKTTLLTLFTELLEEYSTQLDVNTLMTVKFTDNNIRADMAKLHGARMAITTELDDAQRLSERLMKYLTAGMGKITACRKFENPFEFEATHKIFMDGNYRPTVRGGDDAVWGRLKCVPFNAHREEGERDKALKNKMKAEAEGVLAWAVNGAIAWWKDKQLGVPPEVKEAVQEWRDADDPLKEFLEDCFEEGPADEGYWVIGSDLSAVYDQWCRQNREKSPLARNQLVDRLLMKGFQKNRSRRATGPDKKTHQLRTWEGLRLRPDVTVPTEGAKGQRSDLI